MPSSDSTQARSFSLISKSASGCSWRATRSACMYSWAELSGMPLMISGVRASSMRIESTSSTMAKCRSAWTWSSRRDFMLSRR